MPFEKHWSACKMAGQMSQELKDAIANAKTLLAEKQKTFGFDALNVEAAVDLLSQQLVSQPKVPAFWLTLADAQMMQGKLSACKDSLARALSLMYPQGYAIQQDGFRRRLHKVKSGAPDPFSCLGAPYSRTNWDRVLTCYRQVASLGMADRRLRFYIFNMLKASDDLASAFAWLDCEDLDDAFLACYFREYHKCDHFDYSIRAWFQKRLFTRIGTLTPMDTKFEVLYFTCLLHDAAENEKEANEEMAMQPELYEDEVPQGWSDEDAFLFEINKETQMWTVFRATLLRMQGKLAAAQAEYETAIEANHSAMVSLAAKLGLAHIKLEQLLPQEAFDIYDNLGTAARVAADGLVISQSEPVHFRPIVVEADACAGKAQCMRLLGTPGAQSMFAVAIQTDELCGDAGMYAVRSSYTLR